MSKIKSINLLLLLLYAHVLFLIDDSLLFRFVGLFVFVLSQETVFNMYKRKTALKLNFPRSVMFSENNKVKGSARHERMI